MRASGGSAARAAGACRGARGTPRGSAADPRRSRPRRHACARTASPARGRMRRPRSGGPCARAAPRCERTPATLASVKLLGIVLAVQVALGITLVALVATDNLPFTGNHEADGSPPHAASVRADRFDGAGAFRLLRRQVELGPRPAGSPESRRLGALLKRIVPRGRYQDVPGGLRNVIGTVHGRDPGYVVVGAHSDTKDIPGFVGANDGASGTA